MNTRRAHLAGSWYPSDAGECERQIRRFLNEMTVHTDKESLVGGIVPHAGWFFSGAIACNVIHLLKKGPKPDVFLIFGMHMAAGSRPCISTNGEWETPFGAVEIDRELAEGLSERFSFNTGVGDPFAGDNTIEIQMPFIKYFFEGVRFVPIGAPPERISVDVGRTAAEMAASLGRSVRVLGSTDLTHYGSNYRFSPQGTGSAAYRWVVDQNDAGIIDRIVEMKPLRVIEEAMENQNACCAGAVAAAIAASKQLGADRAEKVAYASSYEKHPGDSFVGYTGMVFDGVG